MTPRSPRSLLPALAVLAALGLAGCGVKGPLEPPPGGNALPRQPHASAVTPAGTLSATDAASVANDAPPAAPASAFSTPVSTSDIANSATPRASWEKQSSGGNAKHGPDPLQGAQRPDRPFILDGLL